MSKNKFISYLEERKTYLMEIGYIRTSTTEQNEARQEVLMQELGVEQIFIDKMTGKTLDRPELQKMLSFVREGDKMMNFNHTDYLEIARNSSLKRLDEGEITAIAERNLEIYDKL